MKNVSSLIFAAAFVSACAPGAQESKSAAAAPAKAACAPPPTQLVTKDIEKGSGDALAFRSVAFVGYTGWVYDDCAPDHKGAQFDSSEKRPVPFGFVVGAGRVIKGWDEGVIGMQKGGKRLLVIPPDKAYGARSPSPLIPANSTLVFEVELHDVQATPPLAAPKK